MTQVHRIESILIAITSLVPTKLGESAVHVVSGSVCEEDVVVGKYRFGMLYKNDTKCIVCNWYTLNSVFMAPECAVSTPWRNVFMNQGLQ